MTQAWNNRIVGYGEEAPDQLLANPRNARIHPKYQQDALAGVLHEVGVVQDVIVNQRTGMLIDGHLRVSLALREDQPTIPVKYVDLSETEEVLILTTLDPISAQAAYDRQKLDDLLRDVTTGEAGVQALLSNLAQQQGIIEGVPVDPSDLWKGMPEFEHNDIGSWKELIVHFNTKEDYEAFARLVNQTLTPHTKSMWYPARPERLKGQTSKEVVFSTDDES